VVARIGAGAGALLLLMFMLGVGTGAQADSRGNLEKPGSGVRAIVASGRLETLHWPNFSDYRVLVDNLYGRSGYAPVWVRKGHPTPQALEMISILRQADSKGLLAEDYDSGSWPERLARLQASHTPSDEARFDVALTVCTMRYISDLRIGRINPRHFEFGLNVGPKKLDLPSLVEKRLVKGGDLKSVLAGIEPPFIRYTELQKALVKYMQLAKQDDAEKLPDPHGIVFSGTQYAGVPRLARLLHLVGDLPESVVVPADSRLYGGALVEAVKRFQERHGLRPDGYLNLNTLDQLNIPLSERVEQIRSTLERYRWLRYDYPQPPVIVNIPGFRLYALNKGGKIGLTMTVDVGDEYTRTPVLEDKIEYLVFRPYWDVPADIQKDEIVQNIKDDPGYLADMHFEILSPDGGMITDGKVSDAVLQQIRSGRARVRQKPGPENALGLVKFIFPNRYSVYLHDIPSWGKYFDDPDRNISHGCIHVKEPAKLAAWVLRDKPGWTLERVQKAMQSGPDNVRVNLTKPLPVLILYMTAEVREDGKVYFYRDIYGYDAELEDALAKGYPYPR
jgi:murein L,D-transpeptidase YcbB/YkuD